MSDLTRKYGTLDDDARAGAGVRVNPNADPLATPLSGYDCERLLSRRIACPACGRTITLPWLWVVGVEMVMRCPECRRSIKTGYKMGAVLMGLALTTAIALANLLVWIFGSWSTLIFAALILPGWIFLGFVARKWWLKHKPAKKA